jgi:hypothetical protein
MRTSSRAITASLLRRRRTLALEYGRAIEPYGLFWCEEVGDPLDYRFNATLAEPQRRDERHSAERVRQA